MKLQEERVYVVAELSANHRQDKSIALESVRAAARSGADAIKLQTYPPDTLTIDCRNDYFQIRQGTVWDGRSLYALYKEAYTPWDWHPELQRCARELGLDFFSSPFDHTAVDFLASLEVVAFKIASFEINDLELIDYACSKGKPVLISTGVATISEIEAAVATCRARRIEPILLHCISSYPAEPSQMNLAMIANMKSTFGVRVGRSAHSEGIAASIASVAMGASVIEKHFILDKALGGPDAAFSVEPDEFSSLVKAVRIVEQSIGRVDYALSEEKRSARKFMRSLFVVEGMKAGETFTRENVRSIRPGDGLPPPCLGQILGRRARTDIPRGTPLAWELVC